MVNRRSFLSLLTVLFFICGEAHADVRDEVETVVRAAHAAYASNDLAAVTSFWREESDGRRLVALRLKGDFRAYCVMVQSFSVDSIEVDGTKATVQTSAFVRRQPRVEGRASEVVEQRTWSLEQAAGSWRVVRWPTEEQRAVDELWTVAADNAAVSRVLAANEHLLGTPLVEEIVMTLEERWSVLDQYSRPLARNLMPIANTIGDPASRALATPVWVDVTRTPSPDHRPKARTALHEAIALAESVGDVDAKAAAIGFLAIYEMDEDEGSEEAERLLRWVLGHESSIRRDRTLDLAGSNLGGCLLARQDYAAAYAAFQDDMARTTSAPQMSTYFIGQIHERQNDPEMALQYYLRAIDPEIARPGPMTIFTHTGLANVYRALGDLEKSREHQSRALALAEADKRPGLIARTIVPLAESYVRDRQIDRAAEVLTDAIVKAVASGSLAPHMDALLALGRIHLLRGHPDEALRVAGEVLTASEKLNFPGYERYAALMLRGRAQRLRGDDAAAVEAFTGAVERLEEVRGLVAGAERQQRLFFEPLTGAYVELVDLLLKQGRVAEALTYAERAKGRVLLDALQNGRRVDVRPEIGGADREARAARVDVLQKLNRTLIEARSKADVDASIIARLETDLHRAQEALDALESELSIRYPASHRAGATTIDAAGLRRLVARDDVAYLEFVVHDDATQLFLVRRAPGGEPSVAAYRIAVGRMALERRITAFVRQLESRDVTWHDEARALYDLLIAPVARDLRGVHAIGIVPDGVLWRLPLEALVANDGRFLVERTACFYAPSLSVLDTVQSRERNQLPVRDALLAFGNPRVGAEGKLVAAVHRDLELGPLPEAEREVRRIADVYGSSRSHVFVREAAVEERAKELMADARVVHFATHGLLDDRNPMYSQLVLARNRGSSEDGVLQAWEMMKLDIGADLVVLSACDTARGRIGAGEGLIGMSWALFAGGCPSTVATLWKIGSTSASDLMVNFHEEWSRHQGDAYGKAQALREAQVRFIRGRERRHPYYWSAFVLVGSPR